MSQENEQVEQEDTKIKNEFENFGFRKSVMQGITEAGFRLPSPIQKDAIPHIMENKDVIGQAHTGTGKTAAFALPALNKINRKGGVQLLVITPTRELATQVADEIYNLGKYSGVRTVTVYGGSSYKRQIDMIERGAQVVVATPGRLKDILEKALLSDFMPEMVVLDEADEMLDMGFLEDIQQIFTFLPSERQTLLFSATMPDAIRKLASRILIDPITVSITKEETTNKDIQQEYYVIDEHERDDAVVRLIDSYEPTKSVIFCRMKKEVDRVATMLISLGHPAQGLHGDMEQRQREQTIKAFKRGEIQHLVATDVAARGLDVREVTHVFNYHIPFDPESYVHRIGRTGRAGAKGVAVTLVSPVELRELQRIRKKVGTDMKQNTVPSHADVKESFWDRLNDQVKDIHINDDAQNLIDTLSKNISEEELMQRVVSLLMERYQISGPDQIGKSMEEIDRLIERHKNDRGGGHRNRGRGGRGRGRGGRGGNRSGGGNRGGSSRYNSNNGGGGRGRGGRRD